MRKRANREGTIDKLKSGKFRARYYDPEGKRHSQSFSTQKEAREFLAIQAVAIVNGDYTAPNDMTASQWIKTYYDTYAKKNWRVNTEYNMESLFRIHLIPFFQKTPIQKLTPVNCKEFINHMIDEEYSSPMVIKCGSYLKAALEQAVEERIIQRNPAAKLKLPKMEQDEVKFLTFDEQRKLIAALPDTVHGRAIRFILMTGLRASELAGLRWGDVHPDGLHIERSVHHIRGEEVVTAPKSKAGRRVVPLMRSARELLDAHRRAQANQYRQSCRSGVWTGEPAGESNCYIFATSSGRSADRHNIMRALNASCRSTGIAKLLDGDADKLSALKPGRPKAGEAKVTRASLRLKYEHWGLHTLRHTFATNFVRGNKDYVTLAKILGHSDISVTLKLYVHTDAMTMQAAMDDLEAAVIL